MSKKPTKKQVKDAIKDSGGIIDEIARRLGVSWATARSYINKWEDVKAIYDDENERVLDMAETTILESIKDGNTQDAKWLLARKGKVRGYGDNVDITSKNESIAPKMTDEERMEQMKQLAQTIARELNGD